MNFNETNNVKNLKCNNEKIKSLFKEIKSLDKNIELSRDARYLLIGFVMASACHGIIYNLGADITPGVIGGIVTGLLFSIADYSTEKNYKNERKNYNSQINNLENANEEFIKKLYNVKKYK